MQPPSLPHDLRSLSQIRADADWKIATLTKITQSSPAHSSEPEPQKLYPPLGEKTVFNTFLAALAGLLMLLGLYAYFVSRDQLQPAHSYESQMDKQEHERTSITNDTESKIEDADEETLETVFPDPTTGEVKRYQIENALHAPTDTNEEQDTDSEIENSTSTLEYTQISPGNNKQHQVPVDVNQKRLKQ